MITKKCSECNYEMHYQYKLQELDRMLDKFPPYHGPGWNYTKDEVENWLDDARTMLRKELKK